MNINYFHASKSKQLAIWMLKCFWWTSNKSIHKCDEWRACIRWSAIECVCKYMKNRHKRNTACNVHRGINKFNTLTIRQIAKHTAEEKQKKKSKKNEQEMMKKKTLDFKMKTLCKVHSVSLLQTLYANAFYLNYWENGFDACKMVFVDLLTVLSFFLNFFATFSSSLSLMFFFSLSVRISFVCVFWCFDMHFSAHCIFYHNKSKWYVLAILVYNLQNISDFAPHPL